MLFLFRMQNIKEKMNDEILIRFIEKQCSGEDARKLLRNIESCDENKTRYIQLQSLWTSADMLSAGQKKADSREVKRIMNGVHRKRLPDYVAYYISIITEIVTTFLFLPSNKV